jgi:peptidoglycan-N-acetylglucosamine deacetylase
MMAPMKRLLRWMLFSVGAAIYITFWPEVVLPLFDAIVPGVLWRGDPNVKEIALTFDDGPDPVYTKQVLAILDSYRVPATFFLVGERARQYPEIVAEIRAHAHEIANHSDSWRRTIALSPSEFEADLLRAEASLGLAASPVKLFRPASGLIKPSQGRILRKHGYRCILASAIPFDPQRPPKSWIVGLLKRSLKPGAILVLHDSGGERSRSVAAVAPVIEEAHRRGLQFRRVSELLR